MNSTEKGKFCISCQKNAIDFTAFSIREIVSYYNQNLKVCGRFIAEQLNYNIVLLKEKNYMWSIIAASVVSFLVLSNQTAMAQKPIKTEHRVTKINEYEPLEIIKNETTIVTGIVTYGQTPLSDCTVFVKGTNRTVQTDMDGKYSIKAKKADVLVFSAVGFKSIEKKIIENIEIDNMVMHEETIICGEIIIKKRNFFSRLFHKNNYKIVE